MTRKKKAKIHSHKKKRTKNGTNQAEDRETWVDNKLDFVRVDDIFPTCSHPIRIVSWNILAESYLTRRSHRQLPKMYQNVVFSPPARRALLRKRLLQLRELHVHVLCLQEVDMPLQELQECGYESILTPTTKEGNGTGGRVDACGIYYLQDVFQLVEYKLVRLDDLATLGHANNNNNTAGGIVSLQGLSTSFQRRNVALLCRLQHVKSGKTIVVANTHVYWNPEYEYVKLCQVHYVVQQAHAFSKPGEGVVFCGDLNSPQHSSVHHYLVKGRVNAKRVAPWYRHSIIEDEDEDEKEQENGESTSHLESQFANMNISADDDKDDDGPLPIRYICDFTLNRFTRWLRILGIDAALETEDEEIQRTKRNNNLLFERCKEEQRTLVTTSSKLLARRDCPSGTYLVNAKSQSNLEAALVHLLLHHGVTLEPAKFLTKCVVCNGSIETVDDLQDKKRVFASNNAPDLSNELTDVHECHGCGQGYWWCDKPSSSATRVKSQATRLFELCLRGGVPIKGPLNMFDFVNVEKERAKGLQEDNFDLEHLDVTDWLANERLTCPIPLESSYALRDDEGAIVGESLPFTNVTFDFVGALDYVMFDRRAFRPTARLYVPTSFNELNGRKLHNGHLLPSMDWPSDHLAVGVELELISDGAEQEMEVASSQEKDDDAVVEVSTSESTDESEPLDDVELYCGTINGDSAPPPPPPPLPTAHPPRCSCGCVPNIPSMFEMAELRKQARLKVAAEAKRNR